ncbi:MAG: biotin--[acetyl-CoA-carboxylase] ligase [Syntrophomonas sp.]|nr:biotin--[acetyl-CoA-carboxylase] ligase [Syntrophomonas sp.]
MNVRDSVLLALKDRPGDWVSGEALALSLNVSRTAIWKHIKALSADGYVVDSSKKGYRLSAPADLLSPGEVGPGLATNVLGRKHYLYYREIDSTNNQARRLASKGYPEGTVVVAETQTAGRGRRGRTWYSPHGQGIYMSLILRPMLPLKEISRVSILTAVAIAETLAAELGLPARIKWPNDIFINGRKIAGILSEAVTDIDSVEYIVVGIGLNISNQIEAFPADFRSAATSILAEYELPVSRIKLLQTLLLNLEGHYQALLAGRFAATLGQAKTLSMVIGQEVRLDTINGFIIGTALDIDNNGYLLVCDRQGKIHTVLAGEISFLSPTSSP